MTKIKRILCLVLCLALCAGCLCFPASAARDLSFEESLAQDLKTLGLFQGSDLGFELERAPTRTEAIIMLIRLLGEIGDARTYPNTHPFTDVDDWADSMVSYAYDTGLTSGISATEFGTTNASAAQYLTFVLRALGYSDKGGRDFTWDNPYDLAHSVGILPDCVDLSSFLRADVVQICYAALAAKMADGSGTLADKLISDGLFSRTVFNSIYDPNIIKEHCENLPVGPTELSPQEIYAQCSPAVFFVKVYDKNGDAFATGSGFFITSTGVAVTNYHVIDGAHSAKIMTTDGSWYNVSGVYDYDVTNDWAVLQIDGNGFKYLDIGDMSTAVGGATVYAIGSPLGLDNTITNGIISNPNRVDSGVNYIQTSAAMSPGVSGGALVNTYGDVIGICSAGYESGENLNLALPISCISGHSRSTLTPLSTLFPSGSVTPPPSTGEYGTRQELAYNVLRQMIGTTQNLVDDDGVSAVYYELLDGENDIWITDYYTRYGEVEVCLRFSPSDYDFEWWMRLFLSPGGELFDVYINIFDGSGNEIFYGMQWLSPPVSAISFDEYTVASSYDEAQLLDSAQRMAWIMLNDGLFCANAYLQSAADDYGLPLCSVEDFGFVPSGNPTVPMPSPGAAQQSSSRQQLAYEALDYALSGLYNQYDTHDGVSLVYYEEVIPNWHFFITHYQGLDEIELYIESSSAENYLDGWMFLDVNPTTQSYSMRFYMSPPGASDNVVFSGKTTLFGPIAVDYGISFDTYEVDPNYITLAQAGEKAALMLENLLLSTDLFFDKAVYELGLQQYSMADFGFVY